jgi:hypothetical protein
MHALFPFPVEVNPLVDVPVTASITNGRIAASVRPCYNKYE